LELKRKRQGESHFSFAWAKKGTLGAENTFRCCRSEQRLRRLSWKCEMDRGLSMIQFSSSQECWKGNKGWGTVEGIERRLRPRSPSQLPGPHHCPLGTEEGASQGGSVARKSEGTSFLSYPPAWVPVAVLRKSLCP
jgi:hypothetical protein